MLGTDNDQALIGIPAFQAPVVNIPVPAIAIFTWPRSHGVAELRLYELDGQTEKIVNATPISTGRAKLDTYTVVLFIGFTVSDVDRHE